MSNNLNNIETWLEDTGPSDMGDGGIPHSDAFTGPLSAPGISSQADEEMPDPSVTNPFKPEDDMDSLNSPEFPDIEDDPSEMKDFEIWRKDFFEMSIHGNPNEMIDSLNQVRNRDLNAVQRKFVTDNYQIQMLRQDASIYKASKEVRNLIKNNLDLENPATSLARFLSETLVKYPPLNNILIKLVGMYGMKSDLHRKYVGALYGAVQVGGGGQKEDLIYTATEYSVDISTRFYTDFGNINIGKWSLQEDDPEKYLSASELERLTDGAPEERDVNRRRVEIESMVDTYSDRAFVIHVVDPSTGAIHTIGWDLSNHLKSGYNQGQFAIKQSISTDSNAMIDDEGQIIPVPNLDVLFQRDTGEVDERGNPVKDEEAFVEEREDTLYLGASLETIKETGGGMNGMLYLNDQYLGNPSDMVNLIQCVPAASEILLRRC